MEHDVKHCCQHCTKRAVGCRTNCPQWAEHERQKAEDYKKRDIASKGNYFNNNALAISIDNSTPGKRVYVSSRILHRTYSSNQFMQGVKRMRKG